jgi:Flp pilus assembly protein TadB
VVPVTAVGLALLAAGVVAACGAGSATRPLVTASTPRASMASARAVVERGMDVVLRQRTSARQDAQLPDLLERIASSLRGGLSLGPALAAAAQGTPAPLDRSLRPLVDALRHGADLRPALQRWATDRRASADMRLVAMALDLSATAGGATARAVDRVAATLRERRELQAEARALATQARASAGVLAVAPVLFTSLVATIEPGAAAVLVTTPLGVACLVLGLGLEALGALWMHRIVGGAR